MGLKRFVNDCSGNIALLFAVSLFAIMGFAGGAIDFTNRARVHTIMQEAADAAALAAAYAQIHETELSPDDTAHRAYLGAMASGGAPTEEHGRLVPGAGTFQYILDTSVETSLLKIVGVNELDVNIIAEVNLGQGEALEIVIAMDSTGSMGFGQTWRQATGAIGDILTHLSQHAGSGDFFVSFVPFSDRVQIGNSNSGWLSGAEPPGWNGCVEPRHELLNGFQYALDDDLASDEPFTATTSAMLRGGGNLSCTSEPITGPTEFTDDIRDAADRLRRAGTGRPDVAMAWV